jgi:hypothetical protein
VHVETNPQIFSSDVRLGGIVLRDVDPKYDWPSFVAMDEPRHSNQRKSATRFLLEPRGTGRGLRI